MACDWNVVGRSDVLALVAGLTYAQAAAVGCHAICLLSDGTAPVGTLPLLAGLGTPAQKRSGR